MVINNAVTDMGQHSQALRGRSCYRRLLATKVHWTVCCSLHDPIRANAR